MPRRLTVVSAREMPHSREAVREAIWDIKSIELTERKADHVEVHPRHRGAVSTESTVTSRACHGGTRSSTS